MPGNRIFTFTEYAKMDSSYVTGNFEVYNDEQEQQQYQDILSLKTLYLMRDEILAVHGMRPSIEGNLEYFQRQNYAMQYTSISEIEDRLSPIDSHNLQFLNSVINAIEKQQLYEETSEEYEETSEGESDSESNL